MNKIMSIEQKTFSEETFSKRPSVVKGLAIAAMPTEKKSVYASVISTYLQRHPNRMRQITIKHLTESMDEGRFVFILGDEQELLACAQVWPLPKNPSVIECGTWLSFPHEQYKKGTGALALQESVKLALTFPQTEMVIALVAKENKKAQEVLEKLGGKCFGERPSDYVTTTNGEPVIMTVFNVQAIGEEK